MMYDHEDCFRLERLPGGACTHWKAPPLHGAHPERTLARRLSAQDVVLRAFCRSRKMRIAAEGSPLWTAFAKLSMPASIAARSGMSSHERISCFCSRTAPGE